MMTGSMLWGSPAWVVPTGVVIAVGLGLLVWSYTRASVSWPVRTVSFLCKLAALLSIAVCLWEPLWSGRRPRPQANAFLLLADNSQSLLVRDRDRRESRGTELQRRLSKTTPWSVRLEQDFDVRRYQFDSRVRSIPDFASLDFAGDSTSLANALQVLGQRYQNRPVAGILLFTDGNSTEAIGEQIEWSKLPPVYPVVAGNSRPQLDISIQQLAVSQTSFEAAPATVRSEVVSSGYEGKPIVCQLLDQHGTEVDRIEATGAADGKVLEFRFQFRPEQPGVSFYCVRAFAADEVRQWNDPAWSREATLANNERLAVVDRGGGPFRVLYVSGRPNWEFKFIRRALAEDVEVELVGLVRIARKQPKFVFRERGSDPRNDLYRGFDNDEEVAEQYDEPVHLRLGTDDEFELRDGFPKSQEQLFRYHALIIDDLEADYFSRDQMSLIQSFVRQRGGGLLMLGGQESFLKGGYRSSPLGDMLPVYLDPQAAAVPTQGHRLVLTRDGWLQPWVRLRPTEAEERTRLESMPPFRTINRVSRVKPGATELMAAEDDAGRQVPALVAQRFGQGRTAAFLIGDFWRWQLWRPAGAGSDLERAWRQLVRWLLADVPRRVEVEAVRDERGGGRTLRLLTEVANEKYQPQENSRVSWTITDPGGKKVVLSAEPSSDVLGNYLTSYFPQQPGPYRAQVQVCDSDGSEIGSRELGWICEPAAEEFRQLNPNRDLLAKLAERTGGELVHVDQLGQFVTGLPNRKIPITEPWVYPLWHRWWILGMALLCLCAEWGLRRWRGLP